MPNHVSDDEYRIQQQRYEKRARRREEMRRQKRKQELIRKLVSIGVPSAFVLIAVIIIIVKVIQNNPLKKEDADQPIEEVVTNEIIVPEPVQEEEIIEEEPVKSTKIYKAEETPSTGGFSEEVVSEYGILVNVGTEEIMAQRNAKTRISPASMTKVLTVLVAAENIKPSQLDDKVEITIDVTDYSFSNDCSNVGWDLHEEPTVRDLFYGTILPSGADAAVSLAKYVAGSHEAFVDLMNEKLEQLGLSDSAHFTNCVGLYDENHYCTVYDMAMIMEAAMDNDICRDVIATHVYNTVNTKEHHEGLTLSNWFLRRIEDQDAGCYVLAAKTGFVVQSRNCAVSYAIDYAGNEYVLCTGSSTSSWRCIYDHVDIYKQYMPNQDKEPITEDPRKPNVVGQNEVFFFEDETEETTEDGEADSEDESEEEDDSQQEDDAESDSEESDSSENED